MNMTIFSKVSNHRWLLSQKYMIIYTLCHVYGFLILIFIYFSCHLEM